MLAIAMGIAVSLTPLIATRSQPSPQKIERGEQSDIRARRSYRFKRKSTGRIVPMLPR
jgi:hypothetical protein